MDFSSLALRGVPGSACRYCAGGVGRHPLRRDSRPHGSDALGSASGQEGSARPEWQGRPGMDGPLGAQGPYGPRQGDITALRDALRCLPRHGGQPITALSLEGFEASVRELHARQATSAMGHDLKHERGPKAKSAIRARAHRRLAALVPQARSVHCVTVLGDDDDSTRSADLLAEHWRQVFAVSSPPPVGRPSSKRSPSRTLPRWRSIRDAPHLERMRRRTPVGSAPGLLGDFSRRRRSRVDQHLAGRVHPEETSPGATRTASCRDPGQLPIHASLKYSSEAHREGVERHTASSAGGGWVMTFS